MKEEKWRENERIGKGEGEDEKDNMRDVMQSIVRA